MNKNNLLKLAVIFALLIVLFVACAPAQPSNYDPNTTQILNPDIPVITPNFYIAGNNNVVRYEVVSFVDGFGRKCTSVLSMYQGAGPALYCQ